MKSFVSETGLVLPLDRPNVDTDQIIPKQFLKRIERTGFGQYLFFDWRFLADGKTPNPDFELNSPRFQGATILLAGKNFGCGSSREHAPWALDDFGIRAVIAPSYADIFYNNCFKNGILPVTLPEVEVQSLFDRTAQYEGYSLTVDLDSQMLSDTHGFRKSFDVDPFRRYCLLNGLDDIGLSLQFEAKITEFEAHRPAWMMRAE